MSKNAQGGAGESPARDSAGRSIPPVHRTSILLFCVSTFFYWAALYLYVPILPVYAQSLGASLSMVGIVVASYALPQLLLRVPMGLWSDALGRRKPLVAAGVVMTLVGALGLGLAPTPLFLTVARTATGIGASVWVLFSVYFVSFYPPENTGRAMGFINFVQSTALVVASLGGGIIAQALGSRQTFFGATLLGALSLFALLPASEPRPSIRGTFTWRDFARVAANPHLLVVSAMGILLQFAQFATVFGFIPVYGAKIGASNAELGILTMLATMAGAVSALAAPRVAERWGYAFTLLLGSMLMAVSLVAVPFITSVLVLDADQFVAGLGRGMLVTTLMTQSIQAVPSHQRATAMGIYQATYSVGMLLGPLISGFVADSQGLAVVFYLSAAISLMIAVTAYLPIKSRPS